MSDFYELVTARPTILAASAANLRTEPSAKFLTGQPALVPIGGAEVPFAWDGLSLAADNGTTVIKPNDIAPLSPGRFLIVQAVFIEMPLRQTLYVDGSFVGVSTGSIADPFVTIQAAINAVPAPTLDNEVWTILIAGGRYNESPIIPANRWVVLQAIEDTSTPFNASVLLGPPGGPFGDISWNMGLVGNRNGCGVKGIVCNSILIFATALGGTALVVEDSVTAPGGIVVIAGVWTGNLVLNRSVVQGGITAGDAALLSSENVAIGGSSLKLVIDSDSRFIGNVTINEAVLPGTSVFKGSFVTGPLSCPASNYTMDAEAMRYASKQGAFVTTPASGTVNLFRGDAGFYQARHTVRTTGVNAVLNYADDYVACTPLAATTITVTLPSASMFADLIGGADTAGGVIRAPGRHVQIRNIQQSGATGIVQVTPLGADRIDGAGPAAPLFLYAGESCVLVPIFHPSIGQYSWEPIYRVGRNYQVVSSLGLSATAGAVYATKLTLGPTPALSGIYRVNYRLIASVSNANTDVQSRLRNVTDAVDMVVCRSDPDSTAERTVHSGYANVTFLNAAKTFTIDFQAPSGAANAQVEDAYIEIWRVG
jgi:hypothetical protein